MNTYLIFNSSSNSYIPTNETNHLVVREKVAQLSKLFPGQWDYSNAEWTVKYTNLLSSLEMLCLAKSL